jgi:capsular polysaccharide biosynthesis protein
MQALGIPLEDAYFTHCGRVVRVEQLVAAAPDLENPVYVAPEMREVYARLLAGLPDEGGPRPERLFISRRAEKYAARWCVQTPEIEQWFAARGFEVVYPEDLSYAQQARMFASAKVVAGFAGSGLFNMMFAPDARVVIISGDSYVARNEQLIAAVNGNEVHYFWGSSDLPQGKTFDYRAFKSPFSFDLGRFEPELVDVL